VALITECRRGRQRRQWLYCVVSLS